MLRGDVSGVSSCIVVGCLGTGSGYFNARTEPLEVDVKSIRPDFDSCTSRSAFLSSCYRYLTSYSEAASYLESGLP